VALASNTERLPEQVTVVLAGEADSTVGEQFHAALFGVVTGPHPRIVIDLRGLVFIDSTSLGILLAARHAALCHGNVLRIAHPRGQVLRVLQVAGLLSVLSATGSSEAHGAAAG